MDELTYRLEFYYTFKFDCMTLHLEFDVSFRDDLSIFKCYLLTCHLCFMYTKMSYIYFYICLVSCWRNFFLFWWDISYYLLIFFFCNIIFLFKSYIFFSKNSLQDVLQFLVFDLIFFFFLLWVELVFDTIILVCSTFRF